MPLSTPTPNPRKPDAIERWRRQGRPSRFGPRSPWRGGDLASDLSPGDVSAAIRSADAGDPRRYAQMVRQIQDRDDHLVSVMGTRKRAVANLGYQIKPASTDRADREVATWVQRKLDAMRGFRRGMLNLLDAILLGYAPVEIAWKPSDGQIVPAGLLYRPSEWLRPSLDNPLEWRLEDPAALVAGAPLWPDHWIVHTSQGRTGWPIEAGLGRCVLWLYLFGRNGYADWVTYNEKYGSPLRVGQFKAGTPSTDIDDLEEAIAQLGVDAYAVISDEWKISFVGDQASKTGTPTYQAFLDFNNRCKSKVVLGQTLTTEAGENGTQALGTVQNTVRADIRDSDAGELGETLTDGLVAPMVRLNFGARAPCPTLAFDVTPPADEEVLGRVRKARAEVFDMAVKLGVSVSVAQVREELAIRPPEPGEALLNGGVAPGAIGLPSAPFSASALALLGPARRCGGCGGVVRASATSNPSEAFGGLVEAGTPAVRAAWRVLVDEVRGGLAAGAGTAEVIQALRAADLEPLTRALASVTLEAEALGLLQARTGESRPRLPTSSPITDVAAWAEATGISVTAWRQLVSRHTSRAADNAAFAVLRLTQELVAAHEAGDLEVAAAAAAADPRRSDGLVEVSAGIAWGQGRADEQGRTARRKPYLRYHTQQDDRVRPAHAAMEGRVYAADHAIWNIWRPPNGWNCRCWTTSHTLEEVLANGWEIASGWPDEIEPGGQGPAEGVKLGGKPAMPDRGFQRDWQKTTEEHDFSGFPPAWQAALDTSNAMNWGAP